MTSWRWALIAAVAACSTEKASEPCGGCPAGEACVSGACARICTHADECAVGQGCVGGACQTTGGGDTCEPACGGGTVCLSGSCVAVPTITAIDGTGGADGDPTHRPQHLRDRLVIRGQNLAGTTVTLRRAGQQSATPLQPCGTATNTTLEVALPSNVVAGEHVLTVHGQAGSTCDATVWLLQGEPGSGGGGAPSCMATVLDCDDNGYYLDASESSVLNEVYVNGSLAVGGGFAYTQQTITTGQSTPRCACDTSTTGLECPTSYETFSNEGTTCYDWTAGGQYPYTQVAGSSPYVSMAVNHDGSVLIAGALQAPLLRDANDTTYHVDPAATSRLNEVDITGAINCTACIGTTDITNGSIQSGDIASGAVTSTEIADGTIATIDIAPDAVTSAKINSVSYTKISGSRNALYKCGSAATGVIGVNQSQGGCCNTDNYGYCQAYWTFIGYLY